MNYINYNIYTPDEILKEEIKEWLEINGHETSDHNIEEVERILDDKAFYFMLQKCGRHQLYKKHRGDVENGKSVIYADFNEDTGKYEIDGTLYMTENDGGVDYHFEYEEEVQDVDEVWKKIVEENEILSEEDIWDYLRANVDYLILL